MSKYTSEVRFICENMAGLVESVGYTGVDDVLKNSREKIFDFSYPIFDEAYRPVLETKILKHYYTREIGAESYGLWKLWLDRKMSEIMPYYNQLYKSELIDFNPMYDVDLTMSGDIGNTGKTTKNGEFNETNSVNRESTNSGSNSGKQEGGNKVDRWDYYSDTPQGGVNGLVEMNYLTNARHVTDDGLQSKVENSGSFNGTENVKDNGNRSGKNSDISEMNTTEKYLKKVVGKNGGSSYSERLKEFRQTFLNIDMLVIDELSDLFMNLW